MANPAPHSLTDSQFINMILNPTEPDGFYFKPLADELVKDEETGAMNLKDPQGYLYRFLQTPGNEHYGQYLKSTKPNETTAGDIAYQNLYADSWIQGLKEGRIEAPDVLAIGSDYITKEMILGMSHEELPYVSQEEYQRRKNAGESVIDIFPWAQQHHTWGDYIIQGNMNQGIYGRSLFEAKEQGTLDLSPSAFWDAIFNPDREQGEKDRETYLRKYGVPGKEFLNSAGTSAYRTRKAWYDAGGEIDENGVWVDKNGKPASWWNSTFKHSEIEYRTREQYERRRMEKQPFFTDGIKEGLMQNIMYEWINPATDGMMAEMFEQKLERYKDPEFIEFQEWNRANPWTMDTGAWSWGGFGKKVTNLLTGTVPSYATAIGVGMTMSALTKSPMAATLSAAIVGGALDASDTFTEAYEYFRSEEGGSHTDHDARMMAYQHYEVYLLASMAWESVPFSKLFRRVQPNVAARRSVVRNINDGRLKSFAHDVKEHLINMGPVAGSKLKAMAVQGWSESITELGQYTTQTAIQAGYKNKSFMDVFDVQEALDSVLGGLLMGGGTGAFGGVVQEGVTKPKDTPVTHTGPPPKQISGEGQPQLPEGTEQPVDPTETEGTGVPVSYPETVNDYISQIAQADKDNSAIGVELITLKKQLGGENTALDKAIFKQGSSRYDLPIDKLFDIMMNPDLNPKGGLAFIEESDLDDATKDMYKRQLMQKYKTVMGRPYEKKNLTKEELDKKLAIDNLSIDAMIESAIDGQLPTIDEALEKQMELEAKKQELENLEGKTFEELEKEGKTGTTDEIVIDTEGPDTKTKTTPKPTPKTTKKKKVAKKTKAPETDIQKNERQLREQNLLKTHYEKQVAKGKTPEARAKAQAKLDEVNNRIETLNKQAETLGGIPDETKTKKTKQKAKDVDIDEIAKKVAAAGQSQEEIARQFEEAQKEQGKEQQEDKKEDKKRDSIKAVVDKKLTKEESDADIQKAAKDRPEGEGWVYYQASSIPKYMESRGSLVKDYKGIWARPGKDHPSRKKTKKETAPKYKSGVSKIKALVWSWAETDVLNIVENTEGSTRTSNGKKHKAVWFGPVPYQYTGAKHDAKPMPEPIDKLRQEVEEKLGKEDGYYDSVLINVYDAGATLPAHQDNEAILRLDDGTVGSVGTLNLGGSVEILIKESRTGPVLDTIELEHNDIYEMPAGDFQDTYFHSTGPSKKQRISLTFRRTKFAGKKKVAPKPAPKIEIDLGSEINQEISDIIGDVDANDIGDVQEGNSLSEESINKIEEEVEESADEIVKNNCLKGDE